MERYTFSLALACGFVVAIAVAGPVSGSTDIEALVGRMTLEEKVGQLTQRLAGPLQGVAATDASGVSPTERQIAEIRAGRVGALLGTCGIENFNRLQRAAVDSRLGIPLMVGHDMVHGGITQLPIPLGLSASWDESVWLRAGTLIARESPLRGCNWTFAPMLDIARDARWGRIAESPGQDPLLASRYAACMVRGIQSDPPVGGMRMAACLKHFVGYGASVGGRDYDEVEISERTLLEVYLPPFAAGIRAGALTVMPAFHSLNRVPCTMNRWLLNRCLRETLDFGGFCISDHNAVLECGPIGHGIWMDVAEGAAMGIDAGLDMEMTRDEDCVYPVGLAKAVRGGLVSEKTVDARVRNVLAVKRALGLFECPFIDARAVSNGVDFAANRALAREVAAKCAVLLKNDGILPLDRTKRIILVGELGDSVREMSGCWAPCFGNRTNTTLRAGLTADGFNVEYRACYTLAGALDARALEAAVQAGDIVVGCFGESFDANGEAHSYSDISLRGRQNEAIDIIKTSGKPFVAVLFNGRPLAIGHLFDKADAVLEAWNPGSCGGWGIADVLAGVAEPYGRLTADFPLTTGQCPLYYNRLTTGRPYKPGKTWVTHYEDVPFEPLVPFGFGLTYTEFAYSQSSVRRTSSGWCFSADVRNVGGRRGSEVVQLYVHRRKRGIAQPVRELKGWCRLDLAPGETKRAEITVEGRDLSDAEFDWVLSPHSRAGTMTSFRETNRMEEKR